MACHAEEAAAEQPGSDGYRVHGIMNFPDMQPKLPGGYGLSNKKAESRDPAFLITRCRTDQSSGTISSATMLMILISGLIAGPAVSL